MGGFTLDDEGVETEGFLKDGDMFTMIDVPGAGDTGDIRAHGINNRGQIVGAYRDLTEDRVRGFLKEGARFTPIDVPGARSTGAAEINDRGQIVGSFEDATGTHGFLKEGARFTPIDVPGAIRTIPSGINNRGQIVGWFEDATGTHGFLKEGATYTFLEFIPSGINNHGEIVEDSTVDVPVPGVLSTQVTGINDRGQIVGYFFVTVSEDFGRFFGFVATPNDAGNVGRISTSVTVPR